MPLRLFYVGCVLLGIGISLKNSMYFSEKILDSTKFSFAGGNQLEITSELDFLHSAGTPSGAELCGPVPAATV